MMMRMVKQQQRHVLVTGLSIGSLLLLMLMSTTIQGFVVVVTTTPRTTTTTTTTIRKKSPWQQKIAPPPPTTTTATMMARQTCIIDGPELRPLLPNDDLQSSYRAGRTLGVLDIVTGTLMEEEEESGDDDKKKRVVGIVVPADSDNDDDNDIVMIEEDNGQQTRTYRHGMAVIAEEPKAKTKQAKATKTVVVSDQDAISTLRAALTGVHFGLPRLESIGGASKEESTFVSGTAVVLGGSDYACFVARAIAALGATSVKLITTRGDGVGSVKVKHENVSVMPPEVDEELELGFSAAIGEYNSMVDTMSCEISADKGIVDLLQKDCHCDSYVSTMCQAQRMIRDAGVFFGPGKVKAYWKQCLEEYQQQAAKRQQLKNKNNKNNNNKNVISIVPPKNFGSHTLQPLLNQGIVYSFHDSNNNDKVSQRGWSLQDFWEYMSWPRDASMNDVRFGLPVRQDVDESLSSLLWKDEGGTAEEEEEEETTTTTTATESNPYVANIVGVDGLHRQVMLPKRDCVLFLSAPYCRKCKTLSSQYTRMARLSSSSSSSEGEGEGTSNNNDNENDNENGNILFAKANATGKVGKKLSQLLDVDAVPAFLLFRKGKRYGSTHLSISKLPSKQLTKAVDYLQKGLEWDDAAILLEGNGGAAE